MIKFYLVIYRDRDQRSRRSKGLGPCGTGIAATFTCQENVGLRQSNDRDDLYVNQ